MAGTLVLVANPGSASRKYALYADLVCRGWLHIEIVDNKVHATIARGNEPGHPLEVRISLVSDSAAHVISIFEQEGIILPDESIAKVGIRIVAPSSFFLEDRLIDDEVLGRLEELERQAPLHIAATVKELQALQTQLPGVPIVGVSDSAFHRTKPDYAWGYGLPIDDADRLDIKRFGYHGISVASIVRTLEANPEIPSKLLVCHLGSGASVTAVRDGKSIDTTMGYSPLEGMIMATRSGDIDVAAIGTLKRALNFDDQQIEKYLNTKSGLLGLGGSNDLRELLQREADGDQRARLAIQTYVLSAQKAIGQMAAALGGVDALVFTGTVGERSVPLRRKVMQQLGYLGFMIDESSNAAVMNGTNGTIIAISASLDSRPVYVISTNEAAEIARRVNEITPVISI